MGTKAKRTRGTELEAMLHPADRVVIVGYEMSDEAIDQLLDLSTRLIERAMMNPRMIRIAALVAALKA
jgi:hypothetical protein